MFVSCVLCSIHPRIKWSEFNSLHVCWVSVFAGMTGGYIVIVL